MNANLNKPKVTAVQAYAQRVSEIQQLTEQLQAGLKAHVSDAGDSTHWGHVGDLDAVSKSLREALRMLTGAEEV